MLHMFVIFLLCLSIITFRMITIIPCIAFTITFVRLYLQFYMDIKPMACLHFTPFYVYNNLWHVYTIHVCMSTLTYGVSTLYTFVCLHLPMVCLHSAPFYFYTNLWYVYTVHFCMSTLTYGMSTLYTRLFLH